MKQCPLPALMAVLCLGTLLTPAARACTGDLCLVLTNCARTLVLTKGTPLASTVATFPGIHLNLFLRCGTACGSACPNPPVSVSGTVTVTLTPINPASNPVVTVTTNLSPIPSCSTAGANTAYLVRFSPIPAAGSYAVSGSASVTFNDGLTITARGDTVVCIQSDAPGHTDRVLLTVRIARPDRNLDTSNLSKANRRSAWPKNSSVRITPAFSPQARAGSRFDHSTTWPWGAADSISRARSAGLKSRPVKAQGEALGIAFTGRAFSPVAW